MPLTLSSSLEALISSDKLFHLPNSAEGAFGQDGPQTCPLRGLPGPFQPRCRVKKQHHLCLETFYFIRTCLLTCLGFSPGALVWGQSHLSLKMEYVSSDEAQGSSKKGNYPGLRWCYWTSLHLNSFVLVFSYFLLALQNLCITGLKAQVDFRHELKIFLKASVVMADKVPVSGNYPQFSFIETKGNSSSSIEHICQEGRCMPFYS